MAIKILVNQIGQHIIADTKQVENKETNQVIAYWVSNPKIVGYSRSEDDTIAINFNNYCLVSDENEFTIKESSIVSILEPRDDVLQSYKSKVYDEPSTDTVEDGTNPDDTDGTDGVRTEGSSVEPDDNLGEDETNPEQLA